MSLLTYIPGYLGAIYSYLNWSSTQVDLIITDTLEILDISAESDTTDKILHAVARVKALEKALVDLSVDFQMSIDGSSYNKQQVFNQVQSMLDIAYAEASQYLPSNKISVGTVTYSENPYSVSSYMKEF